MGVEEFVVTSKCNKITTNCSHLDKNFKNYQTRLTLIILHPKVILQ